MHPARMSARALPRSALGRATRRFSIILSALTGELIVRGILSFMVANASGVPPVGWLLGAVISHFLWMSTVRSAIAPTLITHAILLGLVYTPLGLFAAVGYMLAGSPSDRSIARYQRAHRAERLLRAQARL